MSNAPRSRHDFEVAIVCALALEFDAIVLLIDEFWDEEGDRYGRATGDMNRYTTGRMGKTDVVVVLLSTMGKVSAASSSATLRASYTGLRIALLTGICGGAPKTKAGEDVLLGDVIISNIVIQYDLSRQYADGFAIKNTVEVALGKPTPNIRNLTAYLETDHGRERLEERLIVFLRAIQTKAQDRRRNRFIYSYPGAGHDRLFRANHQHKHHASTATCECAKHQRSTDPVCEASRVLSCGDLGCNSAFLVIRDRLEENRQLEAKGQQREAPAPSIFVGRVASGDRVLKSAEERDMLVRNHEIVGFEMEGAGVWDQVPCIVVKGVCDYADSHKNDEWQNFAAATAASAAKALLEKIIKTDAPGENREPYGGRPFFYVPPLRNRDFVGRIAVLNKLMGMLFTEEPYRAVGLFGLGGIGKTQVALQVAYQVQKTQPDCSVFWVSALSKASFENACTEILSELGIQGTRNDDPKKMVKEFLSSRKAGRWLLVVDNADNIELLRGSADSTGLRNYFPTSDNGRILLTTRFMDVATEVAGTAVVELDKMSRHEASAFLEMSVPNGFLDNRGAVTELLEQLTFLPLAISQAAAYLRRSKITITEYLELMRRTPQDVVDLLSREFPDHTRYTDSKNAVATTWLISFEQIQEADPVAAKLLEFISCIEPKAIPISMLPMETTKEQQMHSIGTLYGYAFVSRRDDREELDIHSLVHLATAIWVKRKGAEQDTLRSAKRHLEESSKHDIQLKS
ncbi:hypothetical protein ACHAQA_007443 [Verticillium albo-atrum]